MNDDDRLVTPLSVDHDSAQEATLRPGSFDEFVGQPALKSNLDVYITAALDRGEALDHVLLSGLPGLGKTTLAFLIAGAMGREIYHTSGPALEKPGDLVGLLTKLEEGDILFVDEIHRLSTVLEEHLYSAMEDFRLDIMIDSGPAARSVRLPLKTFTLVGATTQEGKLSRPFRDRFNILGKLDLYLPEELEPMIARSCSLLQVGIDPDAAVEVSRRSRGTPRIVNRILRRLRDFAQVDGSGSISVEVCRRGLERLGIDGRGLDDMDRRILQTLCRQQGTAVGLKTLAISVGEEEDTIADVYEPYLIQQGFLLKTPRGRVPTDAAFAHLGVEPAPRADHSAPLFEE